MEGTAEESASTETRAELRLEIANFQVDNLHGEQMPVLLGSASLYPPLLEGEPVETALVRKHRSIVSEASKSKVDERSWRGSS